MNIANGMGFSFENWKDRRCLWIEREDVVAHHAAYVRTLKIWERDEETSRM
jgi:hypothetical protein